MMCQHVSRSYMIKIELKRFCKYQKGCPNQETHIISAHAQKKKGVMLMSLLTISIIIRVLRMTLPTELVIVYQFELLARKQYSTSVSRNSTHKKHTHLAKNRITFDITHKPNPLFCAFLHSFTCITEL